MMEAPNSKKRKISATVSFVEDKRRVLEALGYYNEENTEKIALRTSLEARFREIVRPADKEGNQSMNVLEFTNDCLSRGYSSCFASAGFRSLVDNGDLMWNHDVCKLLSITMDEYVAFHLCLPPLYSVSSEAEIDESSYNREEMEEVKTLLQQWHLRLVFLIYDPQGTGKLLISDLKHLVADMVHVRDHVDDLVGKLVAVGKGDESDDIDGFTVNDLSSAESLEILKANHCSIQTLLDPSSSTNAVRSVLDTRAMTSRIPSALSMPPPYSRLSSVQHGLHSLNTTEVHLPEIMRPISDWRGLLVNRHCPAFEVANVVIANAHRMMLRTYSENDIQDSEWLRGTDFDVESSSASNCEETGSSSNSQVGKSSESKGINGCNADNLYCLRELLTAPHDTASRRELDIKTMLWRIAALCGEAKRIISAQPIAINVPQPCKVFGDIHGQLRDLLLLFREYGFPNNKGGDVDAVKYVFDGDFVDRGAHQLEVVVLLFALKVAYPGCVFLLRGNHEMREQNLAMGESGFLAACRYMFKQDYADKLFMLVHMVFDWLPLAAVVSKRVLVLHGGIGDGAWTMDDLRKLRRPIDQDFMNDEKRKDHDLIVQVLWSDPTEGHDNANPGVHCNERGQGIAKFSNDITQSFCQRNDFTHIIRAHQYVANGYKIVHGGRVLTVFSARNYFDRVQNDSAIILISEDEEGNLRIKPKTLVRRLTEKPL